MAAPGWAVLEAVRSEEVTAPPADPGGVLHVHIWLGEAPGGAKSVAVYFTAGVPREEAVVATASQIQDNVIDGSALPVCPGHRHPLHLGLLHGVARWTCTRDPARHSEPILRAAAR